MTNADKEFMKRAGKFFLGLYLTLLSAVMLYTVIRAIPDGLILRVNGQYAGETFLDIIVLLPGVVLGPAFTVYQCIKLWRGRIKK